MRTFYKKDEYCYLFDLVVVHLNCFFVLHYRDNIVLMGPFYSFKSLSFVTLFSVVERVLVFVKIQSLFLCS